MSLSKVSVLCKFCESEKAKYTCPKCYNKYCSSECYRSKKHVECSESFFKEWVFSSLQNRDKGDDKKRILDIIKRDAELDSDDDEPESEELSLQERFADIDLSKEFDDKAAWDRLTQEERLEFETLLKEENFEGIVPVKEPWWVQSEVNLVEPIGATSSNRENSTFSLRPPFPIGIKKLAELTSLPAADSIQYNVISILYGYVFIMRIYNYDVGDFMEEVIENFFYLTPVLSEKMNYFTLEEVVQDSTRLLIDSKFNMPIEFAKHLARDVYSIINGPTNTQANYYTLCALSDVQMLISNNYQIIKSQSISKEAIKSKKKLSILAIKKLDFLMSWCQENNQILRKLSSELELVFLTDIAHGLSK